MNLFVIGDSISIEYGPYLEAALPEGVHYARKEGDVEARRNLDLANGANGGDSSRVLAYLRSLENQSGFYPDLLLVNCGLHDLKISKETRELQVPPGLYRQNLNDICALGKRLSARLVWIRTTPVHDTLHATRGAAFDRFQSQVDDYNRIAHEVMVEQGVPEIPLDQWVSEQSATKPVYRDGVHFLPDIQAGQGAFIAQWLTENNLTPKRYP